MKLLIALFLLENVFNSYQFRSRISNPFVSDDELESYIIGGRNATDGEAPWQVQIHTADDNFLCGGSILTEYWIVTSAWCMNPKLMNQPYIRYNTLTFEGGQMLGLKHTFQHSGYNMTSHENDIGLAQTYWQMALGRINADKIKLPEPDMLVNPGMELNISGWGIISYEKPSDKIKWSEFLQFATVSTIDQQQCLKDYPESSKAYIFCARGEEGANVCTTVGDRGGPAANNRVLLGIIIATFNINCDSPKPDLFSDVSKYISWIKTYIHDL